MYCQTVEQFDRSTISLDETGVQSLYEKTRFKRLFVNFPEALLINKSKVNTYFIVIRKYPLNIKNRVTETRNQQGYPCYGLLSLVRTVRLILILD